MSVKKYTADEQKQIDNFGHLLPKQGGSYEVKNGELVPIAHRPANMAEQPGYIEQPTNIAKDESAVEASKAFVAAATAANKS
jgi:hypothetical protein